MLVTELYGLTLTFFHYPNPDSAHGGVEFAMWLNLLKALLPNAWLVGYV